MQTIVIFKEKHCERYFDASTDEARLKAFYSILKERFNEGYWYHKPESVEKEMSRYLNDGDDQYLEITDEVLVTLPQAIQDKVATIRGRKARLEQRYKQDMKLYQMIENVVSVPFEEAMKLTNSRPSRLKPGTEIVTYVLDAIMQIRGDYEYEGFDFETLEEPKL